MKNFWKRVWGWFFVDDSELRAAIESFDQAKADYFSALRQLQSHYQKATQAPFDAVEECKKQIKEQDAKIKDLEKQLEEKKKQFETLKENTKDQSEQIVRLHNVMTADKARIKEQSQSIATLSEQADRLFKRIHDLTGEKTALAREKLDYFRRLAKIRHEVGIVGQDEPEAATAQGGTGS